MDVHGDPITGENIVSNDAGEDVAGEDVVDEDLADMRMLPERMVLCCTWCGYYLRVRCFECGRPGVGVRGVSRVWNVAQK